MISDIEQKRNELEAMLQAVNTPKTNRHEQARELLVSLQGETFGGKE